MPYWLYMLAYVGALCNVYKNMLVYLCIILQKKGCKNMLAGVFYICARGMGCYPLNARYYGICPCGCVGAVFPLNAHITHMGAL